MPAFPVNECACPLMHQRDRKYHICTLGDRGSAGLQADQEVDRLKSGERGLWIDEVVRIHACHHQRVQLAIGGTDQDLVGVAAFQRRHRLNAPRRLGVDSGGGIRDRPATG